MTEEQRNYGVEPEPEGPGRSEPDGSRLRSTHTNSTISPSDEEDLVRPGPPLGVLEPLHRISGSGGGARDLADVQGQIFQGLLPRPAVLVVPARLDGDSGRRLDGGRHPDSRADRLLLFPVMIVATLVPFVHMGYAAYKVSQGVDYRYPFVADLIDENRPANTV